MHGHAAYNFYEFLLFINISLSPDIKTTTVLRSMHFTDYLTSKSSTSYCAFLSTSFLSLENTQGKKQLIIKFGTTCGECYFATCLHKLLNDLNEESATINYAFP